VSLPGGKVQHYAIYRDITQRKQAELDRERLFDELHQSHDQLQTLSHRLVEVQESERKLLAREIHDDVSQSLTALIMQLGTAGSLLPRSAKAVRTILEQAEELTTSILDSTRRMIAGLRPAVLDDLGLVAALRQLGDDLQASTGAQVDMQVSRLAGRLPPQIENALARILQEALANIRRHARARRVTISLKGEPGRVILSVQDDGVGFQGQAARSPAQDDDVLIDGGWVIPAGHFGLLGIQERVRQLNGKLKVTSIPGQGTLLEVELPL
jgi:signal transduction histidine kinase